MKIFKRFFRSRQSVFLRLHADDDEPGQVRSCSFLSIFLRNLTTWRVTALVGAIITFLVFLINLIFLIWTLTLERDAESESSFGQGLIMFYQGDCTTTERLSTTLSLLINVLGTLLLGASSHYMQALTSPTREDVDRAHRQGKWLSIGVFSLRNLSFIPIQRTVLCCLLAISSVPLAWLYNSVITTQLGSNEFVSVTVYENIFQIGPRIINDTGISYVDPKTWLPTVRQNVSEFFNETTETPYLTYEFQQNYPPRPPIDPENYSPLNTSAMLMEDGPIILSVAGESWGLISFFSDAHGNFTNLTTLDSSECYQVYSNPFLVKYRNVLIVLEGDNTTQNILPLSLDFVHQGFSGPTYNFTNLTSNVDSVSYSNLNEAVQFNGFTNKTEPVVSCHVQEADGTCQLALDKKLMQVVIACNFVKVLCMLVALFSLNFRPLVTVGDALDSFLTIRDKYTEKQSTLSKKGVREGLWQPYLESTCSERIELKASRWFDAVTFWRWSALFLVGVTAWIGIMYSEFEGDENNLAANTFGSVENALQTISGSPAFTALVANAFQLIVSILYFLCNGILTSMFLVKEQSSYGEQRQGLRVSQPRLCQRGSYFLSLPFHYSVPSMMLMMLLHWLTSQSIFSAYVTNYDAYGNIAQINSTVEWSQSGTLAALMVAAFLLLTLPALGFRRYHQGYIIAANCSAALSAACHPVVNKYCDVGAQLLRYGSFVEESIDDSESLDKDLQNPPVRRVGFSSEEVEPLVSGEMYEGPGLYTRSRFHTTKHLVFQLEHYYQLIKYRRAPQFLADWQKRWQDTLRKLF